MREGVAILGIFVADTAYQAKRLPRIGETITGSGFSVGPGGKGSNQAVASARAGAKTTFISRIGRDTFGELALSTYRKAGVTPKVIEMDDMPTGAAFIFVNAETGDNAIIVYPGAASAISVADVENARAEIEAAAVFVTQLEQPVDAAEAALRMARNAGVTTVFNPAPAEAFPETIYPLCDYIVPNETETGALVGFDIARLDDARRAGDKLISRGVGTALITLGDRGVLYHTVERSVHVPAFSCGTVIDTTGAGDAFVGGFSAALSKGMDPVEAARFGSATAGISVTRRGTAPAMPGISEIEAVLSTRGAA